jgi:hypothetical protein
LIPLFSRPKWETHLNALNGQYQVHGATTGNVTTASG